MIKLQNVSFHYRKDRPIITDLTSQLAPGHIYGLLGLNGVGKTTLLKLIAGLCFPKEGTISINETESKTRDISLLQDIYFITDEVDLPNWKITRIVDIYAPLYPNFDEANFKELLIQFDVDIRETVSNLSFGQRKKVNIAFALATNTKAILMDEPTNGLDIPSKSQFRKVLTKYVSDDKIIIISTHQIRDIHHLIDHLLVLENTKLIVDESIYSLSELFQISNIKSPANESLYSEKSIHGDLHLVKSTGNGNDNFDIEFFFNALSYNKLEIIQHIQERKIIS